MQLLDPICSEGRRQAPIDINRCCPVKMPTLNWIDYEDRPEGYEMVNSGRTGIIFSKRGPIFTIKTCQ
jgi:carbonic anhydrase